MAGSRAGGRAPSYALVTAGAALLLGSFIVSNTIAALAGVAMVFWGVLILYVAGAPYVKAEVIGPSFEGEREAARQLIGSQEAGAVYLPPRSFAEVSAEKVLVTRGSRTDGPSNPAPPGASGPGLLMPPPGAGLVKYYQEKAESDFFGVDLDYVRVTLPRLVTEDLELAQSLDVTVDGDRVAISTKGTRFYQLCSSMAGPPESEKYLACPFHSSFAVVLARAVGRPVSVDSVERMTDGRTVVANYMIRGS